MRIGRCQWHWGLGNALREADGWRVMSGGVPHYMYNYVQNVEARACGVCGARPDYTSLIGSVTSHIGNRALLILYPVLRVL